MQLNQIIGGAQAKLDSDARTQHAATTKWHTTALERGQATFTTAQKQTRILSTTYADRAVQVSDTAAQQAQTQIQATAQQAHSIGQRNAPRGGSQPEIAQAKAKVSTDLASDTVGKITSGVADLTNALRTQGQQTATTYRQQGQEIAAQFGLGAPQLTAQLTSVQHTTVGALQGITQQGSQGFTALQTQVSSQLNAVEQQILSQLDATITRQHRELEKVGQEAIATFQREGDKALTAGESKLAAFNAQIAEMKLDPTTAPEAAEQVATQITTAYDPLLTEVDTSGEAIQTGIAQAGKEGAASIDTIAPAASKQIQQLLGQVQRKADQQTATLTDSAASTVTQARTTGDTLITQAKSGIEQQVSKVEQQFDTGIAQHQQDLHTKISDAATKAREPVNSLPGRIEQGQARAEEKLNQSFLDRAINWVGDQLNQLWAMMSDPGFWAGLVVGLLVTLALCALFAVTGGLALVVVFTVAGAIGAGIGTIVSNITNHSFGNLLRGKLDWSKWSDNVLENMAIGALFGAALGGALLLEVGALMISGTAGVLTVITNIATGKPWDQGLLANMLIAGVLARFFKSRSAVEEAPVEGLEQQGGKPAAEVTQEVQDWQKGFNRKSTPTNGPRNQYEIKHTGPDNIQVQGGGEEIWADGIRPETRSLLEAKCIDNPDSSPYIEGSKIPDFIRSKVISDVESEFRRYAAVINDPATPITNLEVITNEPAAVPFFEGLLRKFNIPGEVVVKD